MGREYEYLFCTDMDSSIKGVYECAFCEIIFLFYIAGVEFRIDYLNNI